MPENLIFSENEVRFLKELVKNKVEFMIVGLSAATLQGAAVVTQDIDLWFKDLSDKNFLKALNKVGGHYIPPFPQFQNPPSLAGDAVKLFDIVTHLHGLKEFEEEIKHAVEVPLGRIKIKVLSLKKIIQSKKAVGRKKDKLVLPVLEDALKTIESDNQ